MSRKMILTALLLISMFAFACEKNAVPNNVDKTTMISVFAGFPRGVQQMILDYYGKHWVVALCTINYHEHVESPHPTLQALKFQQSDSAHGFQLSQHRKTSDTLSLTGYFATHLDLMHCTYKVHTIPSCLLIYWNVRAFKQESENVWQSRIPATAPNALSPCGMYKAYVDDFKLPNGGTNVRVLKKEEDANYAQLVTILALQDREKIEDISFDLFKEKFEVKDERDKEESKKN